MAVGAVRSFIRAAPPPLLRTVGCKDADLDRFMSHRKPDGPVTNGQSDPEGAHLNM